MIRAPKGSQLSDDLRVFEDDVSDREIDGVEVGAHDDVHAFREAVSKLESRGWGFAVPGLDAPFTASSPTVYACFPSTVTLSWDVSGVSRVAVSRGSTSIANVTAPVGGGAWQASAIDSTPSDSARTYTPNDVRPGRNRRPDAIRDSQQPERDRLRLFKSIQVENNWTEGVTLYRYSSQDFPIENLGTLSKGQIKTIPLTNCEVWRIKAICTSTDQNGKTTTFVKWEWTVLGYTNGPIGQGGIY